LGRCHINLPKKPSGEASVVSPSIASNLVSCLRQCRDRDDIEYCLLTHDLHPFPAGQYLPLPEDAKSVIYAEFLKMKVSLDLLRGDVWVFRSSHIEGVFQGNYAELANVLTYFLWRPEKILPIPVFRFGKYYFASDGGHRIYAAYLVGVREIPVSVEGELLYQPILNPGRPPFS